MDDGSKTSPELQFLANEVGRFIHYWGFKKVHGRIWTHIFLANTAPDASMLMKQLNVSKALVSLSIKDLLEFEVIREGGKSERGTQTYITNPRVLEVIMNVLRNREKKIIADVKKAHSALQSVEAESLQNINVERLIMLGTMVDLAQATLDCFLKLGRLDLAQWTSIGLDLLNEASSK